MGKGVTNPFLAESSNGFYVVKNKENPDGPRTLVNEYFCYKFAKLLNIPIPEAALLRITKNEIDNDPNLQKLGVGPGLHFGSKLVERAEPSIQEPLVKLIVNKEDIPSIVLFDQIIYNDDRAINPGNLLIDLSEKLILAIDHSHTFKIGAIWDATQLRLINETPLCLVENFKKKNYKILIRYIYGHSPFNKILSRLNMLTKDDILKCTEGIPVEWNLNDEDRTALVEFIWYRIENINIFIRLIREAST